MGGRACGRRGRGELLLIPSIFIALPPPKARSILSGELAKACDSRAEPWVWRGPPRPLTVASGLVTGADVTSLGTLLRIQNTEELVKG